MAKGRKTKKKNMKLRRQLRKTLGCLFMISAIIITAIPVQPMEAAITDSIEKVTVINQKDGLEDWEDSDVTHQYKSKVPYVDPNATIYTTGEGKFHFAYIEPTTTSADKVAVILGYTNIGNLENNALTIPDTVDAYRKYTTNTTVGEACAVSKNNEFLFYKVVTKEQEIDEHGNLKFESKEVLILSSDYYKDPSSYTLAPGEDPDKKKSVYIVVPNTDKPIMKEVIEYKPCYYSTRETWDRNAVGDKIIEEDELYYRTGTDGSYTYHQTTAEEHQRIHNAVVAYIGNQKVVAADASTDAEWKVGDYVTSATPDNGIFAGNKNIVSLTIGDNLMGIGDYAFYNCTNLGNVKLNNGLDTIGNGAFADCRNLINCDIDVTANLDAIGHHAFYNCVGLTKFTVPTGLEAIGDYCFEKCRSLKSFDMGADGKEGTVRNILLSYIGDHVFNGCESLEKLIFPRDYAEDLDIELFDGCNGLKYITARNSAFKITATTTQIESFIKMVTDEFYFEADDTSPLHTITKANEIAFKYLDQDIYEKIVIDGSITNHTVWRVNSNNELIFFEQKGTVNNLVVPKKIGPYFIQFIGPRSFDNNCNLEKIVIPSSVISIGEEAFYGCHNLKDVIFEEPISLTSIGKDAFATQKGVTVIKENKIDVCETCKKPYAVIPELTFTGTIDYNSAPFKFAMNPNNRINYGTQPKTWITFYSGWPSNLTVRYNENTDKNELIDYPLYNELTKYAIDSYPYMTQTYVNQAKEAVSVYEAYYSDPSKPKPTEYQEQIVNSALRMVLPSGIESIKSGLFSGVDESGKNVDAVESGNQSNSKVKSITTNTIDVLPAYGFAGCTGLESFYMGGGTAVDDYAFDKCTGLQTVEIAPSVTTIGKRPFRGCITSNNTSGLTSVSFPNSEFFTSDSGIIYGKTDGKNTKIVECLETRGKLVGTSMVGPEELVDVKEIAEEAFMDCDFIGEVNLKNSTIKKVPVKCFAETDNLYKVYLPSGAQEIEVGAFWNSFVGSVEVPNSVIRIAPDAFSDTQDDGKSFEDYASHKPVLLVCLDDSPAAFYAKDYSYMDTKESDDLKPRYTVYFWDALDPLKAVIIEEQPVVHGNDAVLPTPPEHEGYTFSHWYPPEAYKAITRDNVDVSAMYVKTDATTYTVRFFDIEEKEMPDYTQKVVEGKDAIPPQADKMAVEGKVFTGWDRSYEKIKANVDIYATYTDKKADMYTVTFWADVDRTQMIGKPQQVAPGESAIEPAHPKKDGYTFKNWFPASGWESVKEDMNIVAMFTEGKDPTDPTDPTDPKDPTDPTNPGGNNGNNGNSGNDGNKDKDKDKDSDDSVSGNKAKFKVTVTGGSGSGEYTAGTIINISAYATADGKVFDKWTSSSYGVGFVNANAISTTFTMPANNVELAANFKTGSSSSSSVTGNSRNTLRNSTTTVDVSKGGISNTDLASADVSGSSDNYVIKITEDAQATAAVIAALEAKYGDISNLAYLPMDISLYDSTGQTKITDVSGISVNIKLPLPDELIQYAGNNRAASVVNGQLEELSTKFTTIDGVPCIQFSATHFSPYTIYVDKSNLTEGLIDATPKTGDPIHPKWFLAVGLACISVVLFCKKDKGQTNIKTA